MFKVQLTIFEFGGAIFSFKWSLLFSYVKAFIVHWAPKSLNIQQLCLPEMFLEVDGQMP